MLTDRGLVKLCETGGLTGAGKALTDGWSGRMGKTLECVV